MKTIRDIDIKNKTVLVRVDYNVAIQDGKITDDLRIRASLPTIKYLLDHGAKHIFLISHLGRPDSHPDDALSLQPVATALRRLLPDTKIAFHTLPTPGEKIPTSDAKITLLENLRFDPGEESNDKNFIKNIIDSTGADVYIQDGFAVVHRAHASTDAAKHFLPIYAGLLLKTEISGLSAAITNPTHPVLLIIGGAKVADKQPLIDKFANIADHIVVGGKIAADGYTSTNPKIYVAEDFDTDSTGAKLDIGPVATGRMAELITNARTIIWNGLLGKAEDPAYATASTIAAELIGENTHATSIICGGDTTGFVKSLLDQHPDLHYSLISTGGGAALEYLAGNSLPGITAIQK